jgi:antitoxin Phd
MPAITYRNSEGNLVDVSTVTATDLKNEFGTVFDRALADGAVAITKHAQPKAVLLSFAEFTALTNATNTSLDALAQQFDDAMLARMQSPRAKKAMAAAFDASPAKLGNAAVKAATRRR